MRSYALSIAVFCLAIPRLADAAMPQVPVELYPRQAEIEDMAWPLQVAAASQCRGAAKHLTGIELVDTEGQLVVRHVRKGSPAEGKVLQGDVVRKINGRRLESGNDDPDTDMWGFYRDRFKKDAVHAYEIDRAGAAVQVSVDAVSTCDWQVLYLGRQVPAFRAGTTLFLGPEFDREAPQPWMGQVRLAHEFAHFIARHDDARNKVGLTTAILTGVASVATGADFRNINDTVSDLVFGQKQELEADPIAVELAVKAGIDRGKVIDYWLDFISRGGLTFPGSQFVTAHPASKERVAKLEALRTGSGAITGGATATP